MQNSFDYIYNLRNCLPIAADFVYGDINLVYYSHIPAFLLTLLFAVFIYKNSKELSARILTLFALDFCLWVIANLFSWLSSSSFTIMFFWSLLGIFDVLLYFFVFYFTYTFIYKSEPNKYINFILVLLVVPIIVLAPTAYNLAGFSVPNCTAMDNNYNGYLFLCKGLLSLLSLSVVLFDLFYTKIYNRKQLIILGSSIFLLLLSLYSTSYLADFYGRFDIEIYGLIGVVFFTGALMYLIVKFKSFDIKLLGTQAIVVFLIFITGSQFFFLTNYIDFILNSVSLIVIIILGYFLIRSVVNDLKQQEKIEALIKARSEFLDVASHQLRTPVSLITGTLSMLKEEGFRKLPQEQQDKLIDGIFHKSQKLTNIVNDILQATQMDIVDFKLTPEMLIKLDLRKVMKDICEDLADKAKDKGLQFDYQNAVSGEPLFIMGSDQFLGQALFNLVDNAIKYTVKGYVRLKLDASDSKVILMVTDSGIGIPLADQAKMFDKFKRASNAVNAYTDGSGLGLFITQKVVVAHPGGQIYFESAGEGRGTAFVVELNKA